MEIFTATELKKIRFTHYEMVIESDFMYEYWRREIMGVHLEITNEYDLNGTLRGQIREINETVVSNRLTKHSLLQLIKILEL